MTTRMKLVKTGKPEPWTEERMQAYHNRVQYINGLPGTSKVRFDNGDLANGLVCVEDGEVWYGAVDSNGQEYETREQPYERIDLTQNLTIISGTAPAIMQYLQEKLL